MALTLCCSITLYSFRTSTISSKTKSNDPFIATKSPHATFAPTYSPVAVSPEQDQVVALTREFQQRISSLPTQGCEWTEFMQNYIASRDALRRANQEAPPPSSNTTALFGIFESTSTNDDALISSSINNNQEEQKEEDIIAVDDGQVAVPRPSVQEPSGIPQDDATIRSSNDGILPSVTSNGSNTTILTAPSSTPNIVARVEEQQDESALRPSSDTTNDEARVAAYKTKLLQEHQQGEWWLLCLFACLLAILSHRGAVVSTFLLSILYGLMKQKEARWKDAVFTSLVADYAASQNRPKAARLEGDDKGTTN